MNRRQALLTLGFSFGAGCSGTSTRNEDRETQSSVKTATTSSDIRFPYVTAEGDAVPDEENVTVTVETEQVFTESHPARIVVRFTNTGKSVQKFNLGATPPYSNYIGSHTNGRSRIVIVPDTREDTFGADPAEKTPDEETETATRYRLVPTEPINRCWYAGGVVGTAAPRELSELQPEETLTERYTVLAHPLNEQCLPLGEYRFEEEGYFGEGTSWGFSIFIRQPGL